MAEPRSRKGALDLKGLIKSTTPKAPSFEEFLKRPEVASLVEGISIINKYRDNPSLFESDPVTLERDVLRLAAINVHSSSVTAYAEGLSKSADDNLKLARSKAWRDIKEAKKTLEDEGETVQITEKESEHLARLISEDSVNQTRDAIIVAEILRHGYFAIKDFIQLADNILKRLAGERFNANKM